MAVAFAHPTTQATNYSLAVVYHGSGPQNVSTRDMAQPGVPDPDVAYLNTRVSGVFVNPATWTEVSGQGAGQGWIE